MNTLVVATFYKFTVLPDFRELRGVLYEKCQSLAIKGTILLANEGINGTLAGSRDAINQLVNHFEQDHRFRDMEYKEADAKTIPFNRLKVKLKREIVTMGEPDVDPIRSVGVRVNSQQWNKLINDPEVLVVDTRNDYECVTGGFANAVSPQSKTFREFPAYADSDLSDHKQRKIAMYCTGGIRCEKATSYLLNHGFKEVYHLNGGILRYLQEVAPEENLWEGECFVFDGRVTVNKDLEKGDYDQCYSCRMPLSVSDRESNKYEAGISCPHCFDSLTTEKLTRVRERQRQIELSKERGEQHIGATLSPKRP